MQKKEIARYSHVADPNKKFHVFREGNHYTVCLMVDKTPVKIGEDFLTQGEVMRAARIMSGLVAC